ncbi:MAG: AzlC family ABC transporter permease, partial [Vallitaleaceae bacterium]|nr:AzlC family ABC transporter permease [Vallitaleaceae bacterium]
MSKTSSRTLRSKPKKVHPEFLQPTYCNGLKAGIPIALGYIVVSFTFGMTAVLSGMSPIQAILMSLTNLTSAGQFAGLGLITGSSNYLELLVTVSIINIRYLLMSTALSQKLVQMSLGKRMFL